MNESKESKIRLHFTVEASVRRKNSKQEKLGYGVLNPKKEHQEDISMPTIPTTCNNTRSKRKNKVDWKLNHH